MELIALNADAVKRIRLLSPISFNPEVSCRVEILESASWNKGRAMGSFQPTNNPSQRRAFQRCDTPGTVSKTDPGPNLGRSCHCLI